MDTACFSVAVLEPHRRRFRRRRDLQRHALEAEIDADQVLIGAIEEEAARILVRLPPLRRSLRRAGDADRAVLKYQQRDGQRVSVSILQRIRALDAHVVRDGQRMRRQVEQRRADGRRLADEVGNDGVRIEPDGLVHRSPSEDDPVCRAGTRQNGFGRLGRPRPVGGVFKRLARKRPRQVARCVRRHHHARKGDTESRKDRNHPF